MTGPHVRRVSSSLFGNEKVVEVVRALVAESNTATAQQIVKRTGIDHPMVRGVLRRLVEASVLTELPRASSRAQLYYEAQPDSPVWSSLVRLADAISDRHGDAQNRPSERATTAR